MAGFSFVHAADLHIDSPLLGLDRYEGAPVEEIRVASRKALANLVALAVREGVAFVVLAGDVFDGDWRDYNTGVFLNGQLARLADAGIPVYLVQGNHDAEGRMTRSLRLPRGSHLFAHEAAETVRLEEHRVAVHGQSFAEQRVTTNLAAGYPAAVPGWFNVGVLHTALEGRRGHARYAPCSAAELAAKGYAYWALGHVHTREEVSRDPWIVFPGNLQGRDARETGPKGCTLVRVEDGAVESARHVALDVVRWASLTSDVSGLATPEEVVDRLAEVVREEVVRAEGRLVAVRLRAVEVACAGAMQAEPHRWRAELVSRVTALVGPHAWLEKVFFEATSRMLAEPGAQGATSVLEGVLRELADASADLGTLPDFAERLAAKLGIDAPGGEESPFSAEAILRARREAVDLLRYRLERARGPRS